MERESSDARVPPRVLPVHRYALRPVKIAPSLLSADFTRLAEEIRSVERGGADMLHIDVMDGHFVPNITFGPPTVSAIRRRTELFLDVHLMIERPERYLEAFLKAGSDRLTIHVESTQRVREILTSLRNRGKGAGITLRPSTPMSAVLPYLDVADLLLIMTVEPGFGGQEFQPENLRKIPPALALRSERAGEGFWVQVDGGINEGTISEARRWGGEVFVAGSAVFEKPDRAGIIGHLRAQAAREGE